MSYEPTSRDAELFRRIEEVVHYIWDPIGICEQPRARDEYHSYLAAIYGKVKAEDLEGLIQYMEWVVRNMGLSFDKQAAKQAAHVMLEWKHHLDDQNS